MGQLGLRLGWNKGCRRVFGVLHTASGLSKQGEILLLVEVGVKEHLTEHLPFEHDPEFLPGWSFLFAFFLLLILCLSETNLVNLATQVHQQVLCL